MSATEILAEARKLSPEERQEIAETLLDELEMESPEFLAELDRRAEHARTHPEDCVPWEVVLAELPKRLEELKKSREII